ncbi:Mitochondrial dicarboxylate carrier Solute carrier family 25 member 10 [Larimichthys crocea]|uniref:Mitochondrial dicarboxylate carrier Solute carrier family 25 member 10 n=1 Tax=Larimichthys crocea TaxID=215358 RepID=A0A6G0HW23_LARCR|nr:Mitochondrial dicarboxylate carrier Solute carrier family 25 member 10 [Larimichthys crocea]
MIGMALKVVRREGYLALYSGLSASLCRQMTYSLSRFAIYETVRDKMNREKKGLIPFYQKVMLGAFGEGMRNLFSGATVASTRGALVSVGQLSCYDQSKQLVLVTGYLTDNILTHFLASVFAGVCATVLCQPLDVVKTRLMNSKVDYGGLVPAAIRLIPHTVFTFIFLEQLRQHFGAVVVT